MCIRDSRRKEQLVLGMLQDKTHGAAQAVKIFFGAHFTAMKAHTALLRGYQACNTAEKRCFSAAVGAIKADMPLRQKGQINPLKNLADIAVPFIMEMNVFEAEDAGYFCITVHTFDPGTP